MNPCEIGIIGLGAMGRNLLLNIGDHGYRTIGLDKDVAKVRLVITDSKGSEKVEATEDMHVFLNRLSRPRAFLLLVPAGAPVDSVINEVLPLLSPGDLVIDAGNSHFTDTDRREKALLDKGIHFFGMGISGGESGARHGPSIMPGGNKAAYERVRRILESISAQVGAQPCAAYLGPGSSGHYVKMVHNGIEYGLMQLIAETYHLMKMALELSDDECHAVYDAWNQSELASYLLEITAKIFLKKDDKSKNRLIDVILGVAKQNGTGKWTCQDAMELQTPLPTINAAVVARDLSFLEKERKNASVALVGTHRAPAVRIDRKLFLEQLRQAYAASCIITFAQGMALLQKASLSYHYDLNLESVAQIWRGGCIIRAALLDPIMSAYRSNPKLPNLLLDPRIASDIAKQQGELRAIVQASAGLGFPVPAMMASLSYYDGYRSAWLPENLVQAQRDYFGSHQYERIDEPGLFHSNWELA